MTERFTINKGETTFNLYIALDGADATEICGKKGQIKGASCFGRTITLGGQELNRGSSIDFLRKQVKEYNAEHAAAPLELPEKGWFFGLCCGSTDDEIVAIFNALYPLPAPNPESPETSDEGTSSEEPLPSDPPKVINPSPDTLVESREDKLFRYIRSDLIGGDDDDTYLEEISALFSLDELYEKAIVYKDSDEEKSDTLFKYAARHNHTDSLYELGCIYMNGSESIPQHTLSAVKNLTRAAEAGHVEAHTQLGILQERRNKIDDAIRNYTVACDQFSSLAAYRLGLIYENNPEFKDNDEALKYYRMAFIGGHQDALNDINRLESL